jgi:Zn-dependent M16 (insulinase) family peptidase
MTAKHGFELIKAQEIPEINILARLLRHVKTGAELLSLENDDENKVFGIVFRTPPPDSTGLPHIMEHSVLSGSRKYPVKDPFIELARGSLNTFLNAMTSPDHTSYPVASQNVKDLYNLVDVYLDSVFHPRITPHTLQQEGWHYELENPEDPMTYKGVVFNEMKGAYSSPDNLLYRHSMRSLFPDTPYSRDSGGDPAEIPNLTYEQFAAFHKTYYHPSNARIFFYGDDDPVERLRVLDAYLGDFEAWDVDSSIPLQPRLDAPRRITIPYDVGADDGAGTDHRKGFLTVNWLLTEDVDARTALGLDILEHVLVGTPASPLRKALLDSGLGEGLAGGGMGTMRQTYFSVGLKGIDVNHASAVEKLILDTLSTLAHQGIDPDTVAASLNTVEFSLRENNTGSYPRGLLLMFRSMSTWLYGGDPLAPLAYEAPLKEIQQRVASGERYFEDLIRTLFVGNTHRTTVLLKPDPRVGLEQESAERERLAQVHAALSSEQAEAVIESTRELKRIQETPDTPEALATIPTLTLTDLDAETKRVPLEVLQEGPCEILYHDLFTNGIIYLDLGFNLHVLPQDLVPYVPLFGQALVKIGTETEDYVKLTQRIGRKTGGIWSTSLTSAIAETPQSAAWFLLRSKATVPQADDLLDILRDILLTVKFDNQERFRQLVMQTKAHTETALVPGGHRVVATRLGAHFGEAGWLHEQLGGVSGLLALRQLAEDVENDWPTVLTKLEEIREALISRDSMLCNVTLDKENWVAFRPRLSQFISSVPAVPVELAQWTRPSLPTHEGLTIPARVNYVAKGANLYDGGYELDGSLSVITNLLRTAWLWDRVRVQGGAYGGFCTFDRHSGLFSYLSYRDPNLLETLEVYDQTVDYLSALDLSQDELVKSIIGAIGRIDSYQLPDAKGYSSMVRHLIGVTDEQRQQFRDQILSTTAADFRAFATALQHVREHGQVVVLGSPEAIREANAARDGWLDVTKVL